MKIQFLIKSFICLSLFYSCSSEQEIQDQEINESSEFVTILKNVAQSNLNEVNFVRFDITIDENQNISLTNKKVIEKTRHSEALLKYKQQFNGTTLKMPNQSKSSVIVCCDTGGDEIECKTCPDGAGQSLCILRAINACTNNGGCSVVCENKIYYNPKKNEFFILKQ